MTVNFQVQPMHLIIRFVAQLEMGVTFPLISSQILDLEISIRVASL